MTPSPTALPCESWALHSDAFDYRLRPKMTRNDECLCDDLDLWRNERKRFLGVNLRILLIFFSNRNLQVTQHPRIEVNIQVVNPKKKVVKALNFCQTTRFFVLSCSMRVREIQRGGKSTHTLMHRRRTLYNFSFLLLHTSFALQMIFTLSCLTPPRRS